MLFRDVMWVRPGNNLCKSNFSLETLSPPFMGQKGENAVQNSGVSQAAAPQDFPHILGCVGGRRPSELPGKWVCSSRKELDLGALSTPRCLKQREVMVL